MHLLSQSVGESACADVGAGADAAAAAVADVVARAPIALIGSAQLVCKY